MTNQMYTAKIDNDPFFSIAHMQTPLTNTNVIRCAE